MKNILVLLSDDHAQWASRTYGNSELQTPNLDYLAQTGSLMMNAFTPSPVCSPARACFFTGRLPSQHGVHDYLATMDVEIDSRGWLEDEVTLPQLLAQRGYETGLIGKWHLGSDVRPQAGFEKWFSLGGDYPFGHGGQYRFSDNGNLRTLSGYKARIITERAISFLRRRDVQRPFFLFVGHTATHNPWDGHPERLVSRYRRCSFADIPAGEEYPFGRQALESTLVDRTKQHEALAQYYAAVTQIDASIGRLLDELEALGLRDNTLIVYTADHGLNCGHHGIWGKGNGTLPLNMVEESIRIPMILNLPGHLPGGQRREEFVDHLDLFQTLLEYAGISPPDRETRNYPGRSFLPLLQTPYLTDEWRETQFGEYGNLRMVRTKRFKLIRRYPDGPDELFDLEADPRESINLIEDPPHQALAERLTGHIEAHFDMYADPVRSGLNVLDLPRHNATEAWRLAQER